MSTKNTLKDLNQFLQDHKEEEIDSSNVGNKEDFLQQKPNALVAVAKAGESELQELPTLINKIEQISKEKNLPVREILFQLIQALYNQSEQLNATDVMLLNTVLYLQHNEQVKSDLATILARKSK